LPANVARLDATQTFTGSPTFTPPDGIVTIGTTSGGGGGILNLTDGASNTIRVNGGVGAIRGGATGDRRMRARPASGRGSR
jgi:hypothetical protein